MSSVNSFSWVTHPDPDLFTCLQCKGSDAHELTQCTTCGNMRCALCTSKATNKVQCPLDFGSLGAMNLALKRKLESYAVRCDACSKEIKLENWPAHRDKYCEVECTLCHARMQKQLLPKHTADECPETATPCPGRGFLASSGFHTASAVCKHSGKRKDIGEHSCELTAIVPLLKRCRAYTPTTLGLVTYQFSVGNLVDYETSGKWVVLTITRFNPDTASGNGVYYDPDGSVSTAGTVSFGFDPRRFMPLHTHTPRGNYVTAADLLPNDHVRHSTSLVLRVVDKDATHVYYMKDDSDVLVREKLGSTAVRMKLPPCALVHSLQLEGQALCAVSFLWHKRTRLRYLVVCKADVDPLWLRPYHGPRSKLGPPASWSHEALLREFRVYTAECEEKKDEDLATAHAAAARPAPVLTVGTIFRQGQSPVLKSVVRVVGETATVYDFHNAALCDYPVSNEEYTIVNPDEIETVVRGFSRLGTVKLGQVLCLGRTDFLYVVIGEADSGRPHVAVIENGMITFARSTADGTGDFQIVSPTALAAIQARDGRELRPGHVYRKRGLLRTVVSVSETSIRVYCHSQRDILSLSYPLDYYEVVSEHEPSEPVFTHSVIGTMRVGMLIQDTDDTTMHVVTALDLDQETFHAYQVDGPDVGDHLYFLRLTSWRAIRPGVELPGLSDGSDIQIGDAFRKDNQVHVVIHIDDDVVYYVGLDNPDATIFRITRPFSRMVETVPYAELELLEGNAPRLGDVRRGMLLVIADRVGSQRAVVTGMTAGGRYELSVLAPSHITLQQRGQHWARDNPNLSRYDPDFVPESPAESDADESDSEEVEESEEEEELPVHDYQPGQVYQCPTTQNVCVVLEKQAETMWTWNVTYGLLTTFNISLLRLDLRTLEALPVIPGLIGYREGQLVQLRAGGRPHVLVRGPGTSLRLRAYDSFHHTLCDAIPITATTLASDYTPVVPPGVVTESEDDPEVARYRAGAVFRGVDNRILYTVLERDGVRFWMWYDRGVVQVDDIRTLRLEPASESDLPVIPGVARFRCGQVMRRPGYVSLYIITGGAGGVVTVRQYWHPTHSLSNTNRVTPQELTDQYTALDPQRPARQYVTNTILDDGENVLTVVVGGRGAESHIVWTFETRGSAFSRLTPGLLDEFELCTQFRLAELARVGDRVLRKGQVFCRVSEPDMLYVLKERNGDGRLTLRAFHVTTTIRDSVIYMTPEQLDEGYLLA